MKVGLNQNILSHWLWNDKPYTKGQGYLDLRFTACHSSTEVLFYNCRYTLKENQIITSDNLLAKRWGWSRNKVRKFLEQLEHESLIACDRNKTRTIITIFPDNLSLRDKTQEEVVTEIQEKEPQKIQEGEHQKRHLNSAPIKELSNIEVQAKEQEKGHQEEQTKSEEVVTKNLFTGTEDAKSVGNPNPNITFPDKSPLFESNARVVGSEALEKNYKISFLNENK